MKNLTFLLNLTIITIILIGTHAKIPIHQEKLSNEDFYFDDHYSNIMREKYRNYCLKNLEKSFSSWKLM